MSHRSKGVNTAKPRIESGQHHALHHSVTYGILISREVVEDSTVEDQNEESPLLTGTDPAQRGLISPVDSCRLKQIR